MSSDRLRKLRVSRMVAGCVMLLMLTAAGFGQTTTGEMSAGIEAYRSAMYERAISHFQKALEMDPMLAEAHLQLAKAYAQMYIPGADFPENMAFGEKSMAEFRWVLENHPSAQQQIEVVSSLGSLAFSMKQLGLAREYFQQAVRLDPDDAEAYFSLGVIDWMEAYQPRIKVRASMGLKPTDQVDSASACALLRSLNQEKVEDGIRNLQKALENRCDYDDAMAYMNLLYREKADYECDEPAARDADLKLADEWVDRTMATKQAKIENARATR